MGIGRLRGSRPRGVRRGRSARSRGQPPDLALQKRVKQGQKKHEKQQLLIVRTPFKKHLHEIRWRADYSVVVR